MKKTLFIGLGGCGLETVSQLAKKLANQENEDTKYMYLYIDTDEATRGRINEREQVIDSKDFINLGSTNPFRVYSQATMGDAPKQKRILEWASTQERGHVTFPSRSLADGAMAQRMIGRMGLAQNAEAIKNALTSRLAQFQDHKDTGDRTVDYDIWVVTSSCGGTGSSLSLDVLYLINRIANVQLTRDPFVKLVLFMPEPFIEHNMVGAEDTNHHSLNGFSYMWELNAFKQRIVDGGGDIFAHFSAVPWGYTPGDHYDLCRFVIPVDVETNRNTKIGMNNIYSTTAEMLYYLNVGAGAQKIVSNLCNDIVTASKTSDQLVKFSDTDFKWGTYLVPYGYHIIRKADIELKKYLKTRATYEILRYGILGEEMPNDPVISDNAKKAFAKDYIIPFLMELDGVQPSDEDSVKVAVDEEFRVGKLSADNLDANRIQGFIRKVDECLDNPTTIKNQFMDKIKKSINKGIGKEVAEHGLQYTWTLIQNVDDFYLTTINVGNLSAKEAEVEETAAKKRAELLGHVSKGIGKKNAAAAAKAGMDYLAAKKEAACIKIVRSIIVDLTESPDGYLEVVRRGNGVDRTGLQKLKSIVNDKVSDAESAYSALAKTFLESQSDALTVYLPTLADMAKGKNGTWAQDNEFERLYYSSILDYDHEKARGVNGVRVPVRNNPASNNLTEYIHQLLLQTDPALFVNLAMADPVNAQNEFEKILSDVLSSVLDNAINASGTPVDTWLKRSLEEYIAINSDSIDFATLTNPDLIPVLYPVKAASTEATLTRYLYVGASLELAQRFGYMPNSDNSEFVEDKSLGDRFQIIKLPVGLDFYSYKYFNRIQAHYERYREGVLAEREGCHIHKAFRFLNLDKALAVVKEPAKLEAIRYFLKNLYYQHLLHALKAKEPATYRDIMGIFDPLSLTSSQGAGAPGAVDLSAFMGGLPGTAKPISLGESTTQDCFFHAVLKLIDPLGMNMTMRSSGVDTVGHLVVENSAEHFLLADVRTPALFADSLLSVKSSESGLSLITMLKKIDIVERILKSENNEEAVRRVKGEAYTAALTPGDSANPNFAILYNYWNGMGHSEDEVFLNEIRQFFNNILR